MFCPDCGKELEDGSLYCPQCSWRQVDYMKKEPNSKALLEYCGMIKEKPKIARIIIIGVTIVAITIAVVIFKRQQYINSAPYKISQAEDMIMSKQYKEAINMLLGVDTPEADAMREFIDLEMAVDDYIESYQSATAENDSLFESYSGIYNESTELMEMFSEYKENDDMKHWLTDRIENKYDYYVEIRDIYYQEFYQGTPPFYTLQCALYNEVERQHSSKNGNCFTLQDVQSRIDDSQDALDSVDIWYSNIMPELKVKEIEFSTVWESNEFHAVKECLYGFLDGLVRKVKTVIISEQAYIDTQSEKWELDDKLYFTSPNMEYKYSMDYGLKDIFSVDDMTHNSTVLMQNLDIAYMAYCLNRMVEIEF